jgi:hypothetical protein
MNTFDARVADAPEPFKSALVDVLDTAETVSIYIKDHQFDTDLAKNGDFIAKLTEIILSMALIMPGGFPDENVSITQPAAPAPPAA